MTVTTDVIKCVISGQLEATQTWSIGFFLGIELAGGAWGPGQLNAIAQDIWTPAATWLETFENNWSEQTSADKISLYYYPPNTAHATLTGEYTPSSGVFGSQTSGYLPIDTAMVQSLRTAQPGRSGRGRMYLPYNMGGIVEGGHWDADNVDAAGAATATFLTAVNGLNLVSQQVTEQAAVVASFTKHYVTTITSVVVDDIPDGQRRRKDKLGVSHVKVAAVT